MLKERKAQRLRGFPGLILLNPVSELRMNSYRMPALKVKEECISFYMHSNRVVPRLNLRPLLTEVFYFKVNYMDWRDHNGR